jgi:nucleoside-diphosphate-sugar epimerase
MSMLPKIALVKRLQGLTEREHLGKLAVGVHERRWTEGAAGVKILVTGAAGRIGRYVVPAVLRRGYEVVAADRLPYPDPAPGVTAVQVDLTDPAQARGAVSGCDGVIHLSGYAAPLPEAPEEGFGNNVVSTFAVLRAAAGAGITRCAVASSASALGMAWARAPEPPIYVPIDEQHPLRPADHYALSKEVLERTCAAFHRETGMSTMVLRFPWVGFGEELADRAAKVHADPAEPVALRDLWSYAHPEDVAEAFATAVDTTGLGFEVFNVVAPDTLSDVPTESLIAQHYPTVTVREPLPGTSPAWSTRKAAELLGFRASHSWRRP